ncbi:unnamed protein product [Absidia cylindrospora]
MGEAEHKKRSVSTGNLSKVDDSLGSRTWLEEDQAFQNGSEKTTTTTGGQNIGYVRKSPDEETERCPTTIAQHTTKQVILQPLSTFKNSVIWWVNSTVIIQRKGVIHCWYNANGWTTLAWDYWVLELGRCNNCALHNLSVVDIRHPYCPVNGRKNDGFLTTRPDLCIGSNWNMDCGFGEAKSAHQGNSNYLVCKDLLRIGMFCKNGLDERSMEGVLGIQVIGRSITFYLYVMRELAIAQIPSSLGYLPVLGLAATKKRQLVTLIFSPDGCGNLAELQCRTEQGVFDNGNITVYWSSTWN